MLFALFQHNEQFLRILEQKCFKYLYYVYDEWDVSSWNPTFLRLCDMYSYIVTTCSHAIFCAINFHFVFFFFLFFYILKTNALQNHQQPNNIVIFQLSNIPSGSNKCLCLSIWMKLIDFWNVSFCCSDLCFFFCFYYFFSPSLVDLFGSNGRPAFEEANQIALGCAWVGGWVGGRNRIMDCPGIWRHSIKKK